jgi:hypothetical protein
VSPVLLGTLIGNISQRLQFLVYTCPLEGWLVDQLLVFNQLELADISGKALLLSALICDNEL